MGIATSSMAAKLAFYPPDPPTYSLMPSELNNSWFIMDGVSKDGIDIIKAKTRKGNEIVVMYVKNPKLDKKGLTLLYSHGNAADLGMMRGMYVELSIRLGVNLMGYDYSGYGQSSGKPSERNTYADIEAAYNCLIETYETRPEDIVLYGQSVGSGPTIDLARRVSKLRAVVLHSAILSGLRVVYPVKHTYWFDIYKNVDKISEVNFPVLVIHGTDDDIVDFSHGKQLWELCKHKYEPLWIEGGDHCNLEFFPAYLRHLKKFIAAVENSPTTKANSKESSISFQPARRSCTDISEPPRKSAKWMGRLSLDLKLKPKKSVDSKDKPKKNVDLPVNVDEITKYCFHVKQNLQEKHALRTNGGTHGNLECFPNNINELKRLMTTIEKPSTAKTELSENPIPFEPTRISDADILELSRKETKQHSPLNVNHEEMGRRSLDVGLKPRKRVDKIERLRTSLGHKEKSTKTIEIVDLNKKDKTTKDSRSLVKPRTSFDRFGDMIGAIGICHSGCLKKTSSFGDQE